MPKRPDEIAQDKAAQEFARKMRRNPTWAEWTLWEELRGRRFAGWKFRRQHPVGPYIVDFCCIEAKLVVEADGDVHETPEQVRHDAARDCYLRQQGFTVLRFSNAEVIYHLERVLEKINGALTPSPSPADQTATRGRGEED